MVVLIWPVGSNFKKSDFGGGEMAQWFRRIWYPLCAHKWHTDMHRGKTSIHIEIVKNFKYCFISFSFEVLVILGGSPSFIYSLVLGCDPWKRQLMLLSSLVIKVEIIYWKYISLPGFHLNDRHNEQTVLADGCFCKFASKWFVGIINT